MDIEFSYDGNRRFNTFIIDCINNKYDKMKILKSDIKRLFNCKFNKVDNLNLLNLNSFNNFANSNKFNKCVNIKNLLSLTNLYELRVLIDEDTDEDEILTQKQLLEIISLVPLDVSPVIAKFIIDHLLDTETTELDKFNQICDYVKNNTSISILTQ